MLTTTLLALAATTLTALGVREVNRRLRRKEQLHYLRGDLRDQVQYMLGSPRLSRGLLTANSVETVRTAQPAGLLTHQQLSA